MLRHPPEVLRVKRKRTEDPLQALILESSRLKRSKSDQFIFKLLRTDENASGDPVLKPTDEKPEKDIEDEKVSKLANNPEINDLLQDYLQHNDIPTRKPRRRSSSAQTRPQMDSAASSEYVYDVYFRDKAVADRLEKDKIGYIKFDEEYDLTGELEEDSEHAITDDEDSNAEDFYKNDYPDEEYAESEESFLGEVRPRDEFDDLDDEFGREMSDDMDDEYVIKHDHKRFSHGDYLESEGLDEDELDDFYTNDAPRTTLDRPSYTNPSSRFFNQPRISRH